MIKIRGEYALVDWDMHRSNFQKQLIDNPRLQIKEYCEQYNLIYQTAVSHIKNNPRRHDWASLQKEFDDGQLDLREFSKSKGISFDVTRTNIVGALKKLQEINMRHTIILIEEWLSVRGTITRADFSKSKGLTCGGLQHHLTKYNHHFGAVKSKKNLSKSKEFMQKLHELREAGHSLKQISEEMGISVDYTQRLLRLIRKNVATTPGGEGLPGVVGVVIERSRDIGHFRELATTPRQTTKRKAVKVS